MMMLSIYEAVLSLSVLMVLVYSVDTTGTCHGIDLTFNCSGILLSAIPDGFVIPDNVETFDISYNQIGTLNFSGIDYGGSSIKNLIVSDNKITRLPNAAFEPFPNLVSLIVSSNLISGENLNEINFEHLRKLRNLQMNDNPVGVIKKDTFSFLELPALKRLDLSHCDIHELEIYSFDLRVLEELDLSWNKIAVFKENTFRMLPNLRVLDMSHNWITILDQVPYLPELFIWNLDYNFIETVKIRSNIEDFADNLHKLYLRNNRIIRFGRESLPLEMDELQVLEMSNNPLHCDCRMSWIKNLTIDLQTKDFNIECNFPGYLKGGNLLTLETEKLTCSKSLTPILIIIMVASALVFTMAVVAFLVIRRRRSKRRYKSKSDDESGDYVTVFTRENEDA